MHIYTRGVSLSVSFSLSLSLCEHFHPRLLMLPGEGQSAQSVPRALGAVGCGSTAALFAFSTPFRPHPAPKDGH